MPKIDAFLRTMIEKGGSDLHLCSCMKPKIRVHGQLQPLDVPEISPAEMKDILYEIAAPLKKWDWFVKNKDQDFAYEIEGLARFRVNYMYNHFGPGAVLRVIPTRIMTIDEMKLPGILREVCDYPAGLVLVTGPTGSGKSTTLAAMMDYINDTKSKHIITIEDPIEFVHPNKKSVIVQREVGADTEAFGIALRGAMMDYINDTQSKHIITIEDPIEFVHPNKKSVIVQREVGADTEAFGIALRGAIRADPDIILVGEMRDLETMNLALTCATMGMLVFATLHTNNAPKTVDRIIDTFPAEQQPQIRAMLAQSLTAVISQLLCRTKDGKGRVAAHEILLKHDALPATIREGAIANIRSIIEQSAGRGMKTMDSDLMRLYKTGVISASEAFMKATNKQDFEPFLTQEDMQAIRS